jgi:class 3 adenylate cyclase
MMAKMGGNELEPRRMNMGIDVRHVLSSISAPTLVLHPVQDEVMPLDGGKYIAEHVPGAVFVELPGEDHGWWVCSEEIAREAERVPSSHLGTRRVGRRRVRARTGHRPVHRHHRFDRKGGRAGRPALAGASAAAPRARSPAAGSILRPRDRYGGDGFFASFDGPARAIRCACAITEGVHELGLEVRAGLHTGECEVVDGKVGGIAVHIGARLAAEAAPREVLVSSTVKDLVAGSGIGFRERGVVELRGVPGDWRLYAVEQGAGVG